METKRKIRVLSLCGGGLKGLVPAILLKEIEDRTGKRIHELFDMIIGTSTGGIMALLLAHPTKNYSAQDVIDFYTGDRAKKIFKPRFKMPWSSIKYPSENIEGVLKECYGDTDFVECLIPVVVTAYDTISRDAKFFNSQEATNLPFKMWEMGRSTSAAPIYFEPFTLGDMCLLDGGLFSNSPALFGYIEATKRFPDSNISVVSLGTGSSVASISAKEIKSWGILDFGINIFGLMSDGQADTSEYALSKSNLCESYYSFNVVLSKDQDSLDDISEIQLINLTNISKTAIRGQWSNKLDELIKELLT